MKSPPPAAPPLTKWRKSKVSEWYLSQEIADQARNDVLRFTILLKARERHRRKLRKEYF
jgi:hypothetical protein